MKAALLAMPLALTLTGALWLADILPTILVLPFYGIIGAVLTVIFAVLR